MAFAEIEVLCIFFKVLITFRNSVTISMIFVYFVLNWATLNEGVNIKIRSDENFVQSWTFSLSYFSPFLKTIMRVYDKNKKFSI